MTHEDAMRTRVTTSEGLGQWGIVGRWDSEEPVESVRKWARRAPRSVTRFGDPVR